MIKQNHSKIYLRHASFYDTVKSQLCTKNMQNKTNKKTK